MKRLLLVPLVLLLIIVGVPLAFGNDPLASVLPNRIAEKKAAAAAALEARDPSAAPIKVTKPPAKAPERWKPGEPQWGVHIYWAAQRGETDEIVRARARRLFRYIIGLGANSVAVSFPFYSVDGRFGDTVGTRSTRTPSLKHLEIMIDEARRSRLRVTLRPLMDEKNLGQGNWRGNIQPSDRDAWFASYKKLLGPYLDMAQSNGVQTFVIGTELNSLEGNRNWKPLIAWARTHFRREMAYAANWDNFVYSKMSAPVGEVNRLGVDAYFPLKNLGDDATVQQIADGWETWLRKEKGRNGDLSRILLYEAGIVAQHNAYHAPGDFYTRRFYDEMVQAKWYAGVCRAVKAENLAGVYWWGIEFRSDPSAVVPRQDTRFGIINRKHTEAAIRSCFGAPTPTATPRPTPSPTASPSVKPSPSPTPSATPAPSMSITPTAVSKGFP
ncbi:hypothetical protein BIV57_15465 [Mangrovactinospora gilvigrisea]|uniref:Glycoside hydrolase family 5 domain-containing protein n=1 Tax=Mangrovactinospora gilvigrisea TaxID=1428644 RepID=A0A1J7CA80_9ACTN|nr:hypothetical protein [Mangrovactinospora gilvigrisea]OIV36554.1 hypothetical protein BIV57_15465 [Mangrovactinospora gilvigrisea]